MSRIDDPDGEGRRACLTVYRQSAIEAAEAADARMRSGISLGPLDGAIVTIKDLFDVKGEKTRAGSRVLADEASPAEADAPIVRRLRAAGAIIVAKTNMTEFAFSAVGLNPHFGTPGNPADRTRVPGGSTSGGAVAVTDGMCDIAIGSDTGGSTRIPAALCGIVGFKPSKQRVPTEGAFPLSFTLDSIGPMARSVTDCAQADAIMAAEDAPALECASIGRIRLGIVQGLPLQGLDGAVEARFSEAISALEKAGLRLSDETLPLFDEMAALMAKGWLPPSEGLAIHRDRLNRRGHELDPIIATRLERAAATSAADYIATVQARARLVRAMGSRLGDLDGLLMPTTPIVAPTMAEVAAPEAFATKNMALLKNAAMANSFDLCAISLPLPHCGCMPVGMMIVARNGQDRRLFQVAAAAEAVLQQ